MDAKNCNERQIFELGHVPFDGVIDKSCSLQLTQRLQMNKNWIPDITM